MRRIFTVLIILAALAAVLTAQAAEEQLESLDVPATVRGKDPAFTAVMDLSKTYRFVTSGVITATLGSTTYKYDAYYCFEGCDSEPTSSAGLYYAAGVTGSRSLRPAAGEAPAYNPDHAYDVTLPAGENSGTERFYFTAQPHGYESEFTWAGSIAVKVFGEPPPVEPQCARVKAVEPNVEKRTSGDPWTVVKVGDKLCAGHEIVNDPDGSATIEFADGSTVVIQPMSQIRISAFFRKGGAIKTEILLRIGEMAAQVKKSGAIKSDFFIRSPTATASTRGTKWTMSYDPVSKSSLVSVTEGEVEVDPVKAGLATTMVGVGKEIEVSLKKVSAVAPIGKAGTPKGGLPRAKARARVAKILAKANGPCKLTVKSFGLKAAKTGWLASAKVSGKAKGTGKWSVIGKKVKAKNAVAKKLGRNCR